MRDDVGLWVDQRGDGPDVLLIAGLGDTTEAWELRFAALSDRHRLTAYDARGVGRSNLRHHELTVETPADNIATSRAKKWTCKPWRARSSHLGQPSTLPRT